MTTESDLPLLIDSAPETSPYQTLKDLTAGTAGGIAQVLVGQPFDTTKVRLQSSTDPTATPMKIIKKLLSEEGPLAFYKGTLLPLIGIGACVSVQFGVNEFMKRLFGQINSNKLDSNGKPMGMSLGQFFLAGGAGGFANGFLAGPIEHARIRLQIQTAGKAQFDGPLSVLKDLYANGGIKTIYRGLGPTLWREGLGIGIYFMTFEYLVQQTMIKNQIERKQVESWKLCAYGGLAGYAMWCACYPIDVIKSKLQTDSYKSWKYKNSLSVVRDIWARLGWRGFWVGFGPTILRAAPANSATFVAFEMMMRALS
ncbi:organic acid transporter [Martiniozyma asiatica (nom. inval.)]|nr:organic acid transporter [Martiniozyma asiatica]